MVTKTATNTHGTHGATHPGAPHKVAKRPKVETRSLHDKADLNAEELRELDEAIAERLRNPASYAGKTKEQVEEEETKKLIKSLKGKGKNKHGKSHGCGGHSPCGDNKSLKAWKPYQRRDVGLMGGQVFQRVDAARPKGNNYIGLDVEQLAEKVFQRLIFEARIERERTGWAG